MKRGVIECKDFRKDVLEQSRSQPVVVDFWAPWCGPCRALGPVLERLAEEARGTWLLVKVDTDRHQDVAFEYRIQSIPAVKLFDQGKAIAEFVGALPEPLVRKWLGEHLASPVKEKLARARETLARGDAAAAKTLLHEALRAEPDHAEARIMLAELVFLEEPARALELARGIDEGHEHFARADALRTLARLGELVAHPNGVNTTSPGWPDYCQGIVAFRDGRNPAAIEAWIEAMKKDRKLDDDGARRACVALFRYLGDDHDVTQQYRRAFASALY